MLRHTLIVMAFGTMVGCSANSSLNPFASRGEERAQLAAYAASTRYPSDVKPSSDIRAAALINPKDESVKIVNFSDHQLRDVNVWINRTFVHKVDNIAAHNAVEVNRGDFYDGSGQNMAKLNAVAHQIELQMGDHLYSLMDARTQ